MAIPQGHKASPWPFLAMIGMAGCFFLYLSLIHISEPTRPY